MRFLVTKSFFFSQKDTLTSPIRTGTSTRGPLRRRKPAGANAKDRHSDGNGKFEVIAG